jgi:tRNA nucleotidyltransferase/poly(A) polymerase
MKNFKNYISEKINIPADVLEIANAFKNANMELFLVGGAVRDHIQGKIPHDFDLVTNALPEQSKKILKDFNVSDEQGKNFGVLRIYTDSEPLGHELATFRKDISGGRDTKGNDNKVEIGKHITIKDDVLRRDLTINALFYDIINEKIVDLVGGVNDIKNHIIRTVGVPQERFNEDRLRILRVFRFAARTNGNIDKKTADAIRKDNRLSGISVKDDVSKERIHEEFGKVIEHAQSDILIMQRYVDLLTEFNMWNEMFGEQQFGYNTDLIIDTLDKSIIMYDLFNNNRLTAKFRKKLIRTSKFDSNTINEMFFIENLTEINLENVYEISKLKDKYHISNDFIDKIKNHFNLDTNFINAFIKYTDNGFTIDGNDLIEQGFKGKEIEIEKKRLETQIFEEFL